MTPWINTKKLLSNTLIFAIGTFSSKLLVFFFSRACIRPSLPRRNTALSI